VADHLAAIERHVGGQLFDAVLVHQGPAPALRPEWQVSRPSLEQQQLAGAGYRLLTAPLVSAARPTRHDPQLLAKALLRTLPGLTRHAHQPAKVGAAEVLVS
jgi:hypothetical protein